MLLLEKSAGEGVILLEEVDSTCSPRVTFNHLKGSLRGLNEIEGDLPCKVGAQDELFDPQLDAWVVDSLEVETRVGINRVLLRIERVGAEFPILGDGV